MMLSIEKLKNYSKHKSYLLLVAFKSEIFLLKEISIQTVMREKNNNIRTVQLSSSEKFQCL